MSAVKNFDPNSGMLLISISLVEIKLLSEDLCKLTNIFFFVGNWGPLKKWKKGVVCSLFLQIQLVSSVYDIFCSSSLFLTLPAECTALKRFSAW